MHHMDPSDQGKLSISMGKCDLPLSDSQYRTSGHTGQGVMHCGNEGQVMGKCAGDRDEVLDPKHMVAASMYDSVQSKR